MLSEYFEEKDLGLFLDLATYSIITENNAGQYYPDYAFNHPLFTQGMRIYSDSKVSDFLSSITDNQSVGFLNDWNESRNHREKIYFSYDSTNKNCQAGDIEMVEYGKAKVDNSLPIFNYALAYDTKNREPLFYETYPGSINDVSQLEFLINKAKGYGYKKVGFILDRGYFSKGNIEYMDQYGYSFVIMVKGMASFVNQLILENKGKFESKRINNINEYRVYGMTVKKKLYETDEKDRYFHIYHSSSKESAEREVIESKIEKMTKFLIKYSNTVREFGAGFEKYFELYFNEEKKTFMFPLEKSSVIESEMALCGYFIIVTSEKMTAKEAINLYKSRDASEKLFRGDKSYLGNKSLRVYSDESAAAKIFIEFISLIVRSKIYTCLKDEANNLDKRPNYMTVPAALKELEKVEMVRQLDNVYRLDHAVTAVQKIILKAFGMDAAYIKYKAAEISQQFTKDH
jgi:transposase